MKLHDNPYAGKEIIEKYNIEPISDNVRCILPDKLEIFCHYFDIPMFAALYDVSSFDGIINNFKPINYESYIIRLSYTPYFLYLYYWPGRIDDFYNAISSYCNSEELHKILRYLKSNYFNFMDKYKLK